MVYSRIVEALPHPQSVVAGGGDEVCGGAGRGGGPLPVQHTTAASAAADEQRHPGGYELGAWRFFWFRVTAAAN